jgi:hypothetical protein
MPRYFTLQGAQDLLAEVRRLVQEAVDARGSLVEVDGALQSAASRVQMMGGVRLDPARMAALVRERERATRVIQENVEAIHDHGVQVKDLDTGLVDFPTLYRGEEVLLCWRLGEAGISHWHGLNEGFRGRKAIDRDFLDNHRGGEDQ